MMAAFTFETYSCLWNCCNKELCVDGLYAYCYEVKYPTEVKEGE